MVQSHTKLNCWQWFTSVRNRIQYVNVQWTLQFTVHTCNLTSFQKPTHIHATKDVTREKLAAYISVANPVVWYVYI